MTLYERKRQVKTLSFDCVPIENYIFFFWQDVQLYIRTNKLEQLLRDQPIYSGTELV